MLNFFCVEFSLSLYPLGALAVSDPIGYLLPSQCTSGKSSAVCQWLLLGTTPGPSGFSLFSRLNKAHFLQPLLLNQLSHFHSPPWAHFSLSLFFLESRGLKLSGPRVPGVVWGVLSKREHPLSICLSLWWCSPLCWWLSPLLLTCYALCPFSGCGNASWMCCRMLFMCFWKNIGTFLVLSCPLAVKGLTVKMFNFYCHPGLRTILFFCINFQWKLLGTLLVWYFHRYHL